MKCLRGLWRRSTESGASAKAGSWRADTEALAVFSARFGQGDVRLFRAPGRVNLIGEHTDYNHGYVMPMALDKDIVFVVRPRADATVNLRNVDPERFPARNFAISAEIPRSPLGDWANYVKGAAQALRQVAGRELCGADILASGQAPWGVPAAAGLSSSSALTVVAALALAAFNGIDLPKLALARLCSEAEWYVGTRGGIMDQFISILAERDRALLLDCRPLPGDLPGVPPGVSQGGTRDDMRQVPLPAGYRALVLNSAVRREKTKSLYNVRVAECRIGVALLKRRYPGITHLRDISAEALGLSDAAMLALLDEALPEQTTRDELRLAGMLDEPLDAMFVDFRLGDDQVYRVRRRCRHVITENAASAGERAGARCGRCAPVRPPDERVALQHEPRLRGQLSGGGHPGRSLPKIDRRARCARHRRGLGRLRRRPGAGWVRGERARAGHAAVR